MPEVQWLSDDELAAWRPMAGLMLSLPAQIEEPLQPHGLTFFEYSMLVVLSHSDDLSRPVSELAHLANGSLSRVSHAVKRLENRGLVSRCRCPDDGRVTLVTLTDEGQALLTQAAPSHVASVRQAIFDALSPEEAEQLGQLLTTVLAHIAPGDPWVIEQRATEV